MRSIKENPDEKKSRKESSEITCHQAHPGGDELVGIEHHDLVLVGLVDQDAVDRRGVDGQYGESVADQTASAVVGGKQHQSSSRVSQVIKEKGEQH
ncbi:hypothetical protein NL676_008107 [Syzygium grande]|nr:hypothetical protein NL676_008107 [Syzygium grande]